MKSRKTLVVARREEARRRREKAKAEGKCVVLCGRPVTPGLTRRKKPFATCAICREINEKNRKEKQRIAAE